jgi:putative FmdB family regulatory protein
MPLWEWFCDTCQHRFEQLTSVSQPDPDRGRCPKCAKPDQTRRLISRFAVGGQGDLRESTFDGCHDARVEPGSSHDHGHGHDHGDHSGHDHGSDD